MDPIAFILGDAAIKEANLLRVRILAAEKSGDWRTAQECREELEAVNNLMQRREYARA